MRLTHWLRGSGARESSASEFDERRELEELLKLRAERQLLAAETRLVNLRVLERLALLSAGLLAAVLSVAGIVSPIPGLVAVLLSGLLRTFHG
jgi:hypothetical protein